MKPILVPLSALSVFLAVFAAHATEESTWGQIKNQMLQTPTALAAAQKAVVTTEHIEFSFFGEDAAVEGCGEFLEFREEDNFLNVHLRLHTVATGNKVIMVENGRESSIAVSADGTIYKVKVSQLYNNINDNEQVVLNLKATPVKGKRPTIFFKVVFRVGTDEQGDPVVKFDKIRVVCAGQQ